MIALVVIVGVLAVSGLWALVAGKAGASTEAPVPPDESRPTPALLRAARVRAAEDLIDRAFGPETNRRGE